MKIKNLEKKVKAVKLLDSLKAENDSLELVHEFSAISDFIKLGVNCNEIAQCSNTFLNNASTDNSDIINTSDYNKFKLNVRGLEHISTLCETPANIKDIKVLSKESKSRVKRLAKLSFNLIGGGGTDRDIESILKAFEIDSKDLD